MTLLGALAAGICAFFAAGLTMGKTPHIRLGLGSRSESDISGRQVWLTQAGLDLKPSQYYLGLGVVALITFALVAAVTRVPSIALAPAFGAAIVPHAFFSNKRIKNMGKTQQAWPDAIRELIASIESNASLHSALCELSYKGPFALRPAFERFPVLASTLGVVPALDVVRERLSDPTSDRVIEVLVLAHERGGGIVTDILRELARSTQEDLQLREEIESSQLEQKINARAVFVLPWMLLIILVAVNEDFRSFYQSPGGLLVVLLGAIMSFAGVFIVSRLSKEIPESRVFGGSAISTHEAVPSK